MRTAGPPAGERTGGPDLDRIAADLDHIRAIGALAPGRLESLRLAAIELRAIEVRRRQLTDQLRQFAALIEGRA